MTSWLLPIQVLLPWWFYLALLAIGAFLVWFFHWPGNQVKVKPVRASPFSADKIPSQLDTIVIGTGSGGCSCGNLLAQAGQKVLMLEQHEERTGGCTHTFRQEGCEWDTGLHYTCQAMSLPTRRTGALLRFMTKGKQEWRRLDDPYDQIFFPNDSQVAPGRPNCNDYEFNSGVENVIDHIISRIDPNNQEGVFGGGRGMTRKC